MTFWPRQSIAPLLALLISASGCSEKAPAKNPNQPEVVYDGEVSDEALLRLLDVPPKDVAAGRLAIDAPLAGAVLPSAEPVPFSFRVAGRSAALSQPPAERPQAPRLFARRILGELESQLTPIRTAHAHGAPLNGPGYLLVLSDSAGSPKFRVFTNRTAYTAPAAIWQSLAGQTNLELRITWAIFDQNNITADGGPFVGASVAFTIQ